MGILSLKDEDVSENSILRLLAEYKKLHFIGEEILGIEEKEFWLYIETTQNSFTLKSFIYSYSELNHFFPEIHITVGERNIVCFYYTDVQSRYTFGYLPAADEYQTLVGCGSGLSGASVL